MNTVVKLILVIKVIYNFPIAIFDRLGLLSGNVIYKIRGRKIRFIARTGTEDLSEIAVITEGSEYNMNLIHLPKKPIIFDLGGHIGTFSIPTASQLNDKCSIYTFEPSKENYDLLIKNIALNKIHSIKPFNIAITDYNGNGQLKNDTNNTDAFYLAEKNGTNGNCVVKTLPTIVDTHKITHIDLLKMDIEGGEYSIFLDKKSYQYIKKYVNYIFMGFHNIDKYHNLKLIKKIIKNDFRILNKPRNVLVLENLYNIK